MNAGVERIRRFSIGTWIVGVLVISVIATIVMPEIAVNPDTGEVYIDEPALDEGDYPWLGDAQELEVVDGEIQGTREGGYLRFEAGADMMMITADESIEAADWVSVHQQAGTEFDVDAEDWDSPRYIGSLYPRSEVLVLPGATDGLLWFAPALADWTATITTPDVISMGETYAGKGNAVLLYEGDALSGRFQHVGSGLFIVNAVTVGDANLLVNEFDDVDVRASWPPTERVVFQVEADTGDGTWSITLDTPAGAEPDTTDEPAGAEPDTTDEPGTSGPGPTP